MRDERYLLLSSAILVEVRHTFDVMKFYGKTDFNIIFVTTQDAVIVALDTVNMGNFSQ